MDIARRQARINQLVREMLVEGLLNDHFHLVQAIRVAGDFQFVAKIILLYCTQIRTNIRAIANYLTEPNIDYAGAAVCAGHLGICSCRCVGVFYMLRGECSRLLPKFLEVLQNLLRMSSKDVYSASFPVASSLLQVLYQAVAPRYAGDANIVS
ncbi:uncharacterized protein LOC104877766 isoform X4 [Vitis vinifera]|uniref:uncharacterized protein LOC104877766 isoform X4 n=1 Tax=Vitis vinifera TaxID=29760 RepID=UPI002882DD64|nr:uncharacterized protein LOC104877766 isoform X4 [Vitis vinifera]